MKTTAAPHLTVLPFYFFAKRRLEKFALEKRASFLSEKFVSCRRSR
jgi:hypothetical protein